MRIAVDARELSGRPTGVGRYLAGLLNGWSRSDAMRRHEWTLLSPRPLDIPGGWTARVEVVAGSGGTLWEQFSLPRAIDADVCFAPGYTAPLSVASPLVLTIHDVSFFAHPEWFGFREGARRRAITAWSARRAKAVITDTAFSKGEIERFIGVDNIRVVPLGIDHREARPGDRSPMVLFVGSLFQRRRVDRLIEAFDLAARAVPEATLEIVGENRSRPMVDFDAIRNRCTHRDRITMRSYVDDATLASLYDRASVFAFLSEYEGFGFTPLEALAAGVPPVVLDTAVARETCGPAARYIAPDAANEDIASVLTALLTDAGARQDVLRHRNEVLGRYHWDQAAAATLSVLEEAALG